MKKVTSLFLTLVLTVASVNSASGDISITNGSFESGDFTGWNLVDNLTPFEAFQVRSTGTATQFSIYAGGNDVQASDGTFAASHGFDGGSGTISLSQDVGMVGANEHVTFDFRLGWDLASYGASLDRSFDLEIQTAGGGSTLGSFNLYTATAGTSTIGLGANNDTGLQTADVDLSAFAGQDIRLNFVWTIPETFSGPGNAQLDNVQTYLAIPEPSLASFGVLMLAGLAFKRQKNG